MQRDARRVRRVPRRRVLLAPLLPLLAALPPLLLLALPLLGRRLLLGDGAGGERTRLVLHHPAADVALVGAAVAGAARREGARVSALIGGRARRDAAVERRAAVEQREALAGPPVVEERAEQRGQPHRVARKRRDRASGGVADHVAAERGERALAV